MARRIAAVRDAKPVYEPAHDFYKGLREAIERGHRRGSLRHEIDDAIHMADTRKRPSYQECRDGYLRFMARRSSEYLGHPRPSYWESGSLMVRVNPEVRMRTSGRDLRLKLWFATVPPSRTTSQVLSHLLGDRASGGGVLIVREPKLIAGVATPSEIEALLAAEADAFIRLWRSIG